MNAASHFDVETRVICQVKDGIGYRSHLVEALLAEGHEARVVDNFATGKRENLSASIDNLSFEKMGDLLRSG